LCTTSESRSITQTTIVGHEQRVKNSERKLLLLPTPINNATIRHLLCDAIHVVQREQVPSYIYVHI
jgi:hypothetical protein